MSDKLFPLPRYDSVDMNDTEWEWHRMGWIPASCLSNWKESGAQVLDPVGTNRKT